MPYKICTIQVKIHNYNCEPDSNFLNKAAKVVDAIDRTGDYDGCTKEIEVIDYQIGEKQFSWSEK